MTQSMSNTASTSPPGAVTSTSILSALTQPRILDLARDLIGRADVEIKTVGIRPGEKLHETLITAEEAGRARSEGDHLFVGSAMPELRYEAVAHGVLQGAFSSDEYLMDDAERAALVARVRKTAGGSLGGDGELLA